MLWRRIILEALCNNNIDWFCSRIIHEPNYRNISSEELLRIILIQPVEFEVAAPVKHFWGNKLYKIKNHTLESITCDDNGAYIKSNSVKKHYYVTVEDGSSLSAKKLHQHNEQYFIKEREERNYSNTLINDGSIYIGERYYRHNKSIPNLKRMVVRVQNAKTKQYEPYVCVIYSLENYEDVKQIEVMKHGNSKSTTDHM